MIVSWRYLIDGYKNLAPLAPAPTMRLAPPSSSAHGRLAAMARQAAAETPRNVVIYWDVRKTARRE